MLTLRIQADFASFRNPFAREYRATEILPPPSTCYGFLLSLAGITRDRYHEHVGVRLTPALLCEPEKSIVLRKFHRLKNVKDGVTSIPDFQEILSGIDLLLFIDSSEEENPTTLESVVTKAIHNPSSVTRFGPLCLGESESIINCVDIVNFDAFVSNSPDNPQEFVLKSDGILYHAVPIMEHRPVVRAFVQKSDGMMSLTTWPDYEKCAKTQWAKGDLEEIASFPSLSAMSLIAPQSSISQ